MDKKAIREILEKSKVKGKKTKKTKEPADEEEEIPEDDEEEEPEEPEEESKEEEEQIVDDVKLSLSELKVKKEQELAELNAMEEKEKVDKEKAKEVKLSILLDEGTYREYNMVLYNRLVTALEKLADK